MADEQLTASMVSLMDQQLVKLEAAARHGMRVRASAEASSCRRQDKLERLHEQASAQVRALEQEPSFCYFVRVNNTLVKGLAILEALGRSERPLGVSELAGQLGIPKSNVHRMLQALVALRYAAQDPESGAYKPSLRLWSLGSSMLAHLDLKKVSDPAMRALRDETGENVHLGILDGAEVVYLHRIDSPHPERAYSQVADRGQAHCLAGGKAILAWLAPADFDKAIKRLKRATARSITEPRLLQQNLRKVRAAGFAVNEGEWRDGVNGVAAPIRDSRLAVVAAIGVSGPAERLDRRRLRELGPCVAAAAAEISFALGATTGSGAILELTLRMRQLVQSP